MQKPILITLAIFIAIQFIPLQKQPLQSSSDDALKIDPKVAKIVQKACFDCHSNETQYPAYSYIAPVSWVVQRHVSKGTEALNFSTWQQMDPRIRKLRIDRMYKVTQRGLMPPKSYQLLHPQSKLTQQELALLQQWQKELQQRY